ncbi:GerMN domain-containing protein [Paenibacillus cisolokensis]|jgi:spore germination protein GerM|uniref:GerMN domain-containing protein n=1 Tax=Paenibacillus cisolokensis TaxID=1658519 RepID=A0ABQ4NBY3_9BACL|nr:MULTISPECIES: GerMN domain-containing protein [Paenibacillus]ALS27830.1 lipoprotein LpqB [Paenibacillus sp. 32O-W]GIQ65732.1 hypothetical protein PACILC2_43000 [Paenibacillus cisolokensis]
MRRIGPAWFALLAVALFILSAGCGARTNETGGSGGNGTPEGGGSGQTVSEAKITLFFTDDEMSDIVEQQTVIRYTDDEDKLKQALEALRTGAKEGAVSLWEKAEFKSVKAEGGAVTLDIHLPDEARFGAPGEALALESLKRTLFQFEEVESIEVLVDGEAVDSLMGHEELPHPIVRDESA